MDADKYGQLQIVGNRYRSKEQQQILKSKKAGALVLLVPEPGNFKDENAIACLVSKNLPDHPYKFTWTHVGYLPAHTAAKLKPYWPMDKGVPGIVHTTLFKRPLGGDPLYLKPVNTEYSNFIRARMIGDYLLGVGG